MSAAQQKKAHKGWAMEGWTASWYTRNTAKNIDQFTKEAREIARHVPSGSAVLEVAPGPGFLAIELAKIGAYRIVGLDISTSFVRIATENAARAGVEVAFREGDAAAMPFTPDSFDFIVCRAAFKNFSEPVRALHEMYRVLKPGGRAVIHDLRRDATPEAIRAAVREMGQGRLNSLLTRWILNRLRKRAYSPDDFRQMAGATPFGSCEVKCDLIGVEVSLRK